MKLERDYQAHLKKRIEEILPGCIVLKTDPNQIQGFPDLLILYENRWGALEVKRTTKAHRQPNQEYYVKKLNKMSFACFVSPENEEEVLDEIQRALRPNRSTRVSRSKSAQLA